MAKAQHPLLGNREWLKERIESGRTWAEIAIDAGLTTGTLSLVAYYVRKHKLQGKSLTTKGPEPHPLLSDKNWLEGRIKEGRSQAEIAVIAGVESGPSLVAYYIRKHGFEINLEHSERMKVRLAEKYPNGRRGQLAGNWQGGKMKMGNGYIQVFMPDHPHANTNGYVAEHRYVMEQRIGRILEPEEIVDHIDRNRSNNDPTNLCLHATRAEHVKDHFAARNKLVVVQKELNIAMGMVVNVNEQLDSALERVKDLERLIAEYEKLYGPLPDKD